MKAVAEEHDGFRLGGDPRHHISELQRRLQHNAKGKAKRGGGGEQENLVRLGAKCDEFLLKEVP